MLTATSTKQISWLRPLLTVLITLLLAGTYMYWYLCGELRGNPDWFMLTAKRFGIPEVMVQQQQVPLYQDSMDVGWDGQFYFFIASDLLGNTDAIQHIDTPVYRYQRIGLPLTTAIVAKLTGQSWVNPKTYYLTYLALILFSTFCLANFFQKRNYSPWWTLLWSLSFGVQLTLLNALPDGAAEAYLALALITYMDKRYWLYGLCASMSALSREAFIAIPAVLFVVHFISDWHSGSFKQILHLWRKYIALMIPGIVFIVWQIYIRLHFHASPVSAANQGNILAWPLFSFFHYITLYLHQKLIIQFVGLVYFIILLIGSACFFIYWSSLKNISYELRALIIATLLFLFINFFLGNTVMFDYTGSLKAINFIFILFPLVACCIHYKPNFLIKLIFIAILFTGSYFIYQRIHQPISGSILNYFMNNNALNNAPERLNCQANVKTTITLNQIKKLQPNLSSRFPARASLYLVNVTIYNHSTFPLQASKGFGSFNLSYQKINAKTNTPHGFEQRTLLPQPILPGKKVTMDMLFIMPKHHALESRKVIVSLVQEGCGWLYVMNPNNGVDITHALLAQESETQVPMDLSQL